MTQTTFQQPLPPTLEANAAAGHHGSKPLTVKRYYYPNTAAGGLWTSSEDFAKYVVEIQKSYHQKSNKIISAELTKEMVSPHVSKQYGLGLFLRDIGTEKYFGHMGDNAGFFAGFIAHLTNGYGVIIFTNSNSSPELIREINMAVAKVYHWEGFLPKSIKVVSLTPEEKIKYCGRFRVGSDEVLKINLVNGELLIENMDDEKLYYIGNNTFKIKRRSGELIYHLEGDQAIGIQYHFSDELGRSTNKLTQGRIMSDNEYTALEMMHMGKINKAIREYKELFDKNPMDENVSENRFNKMGYNFISSQNLKAALAIFKLNTELYPTSSNCYDSYAEALALMGNKHQAIKNYRKAIDLDDQAQNAKDQLKRLEENN